VRNSAAEDLLTKISTGFETEWAGLDDPIIGHCLNLCREILVTSLACDDEIVGWQRSAKHRVLMGEYTANINCGFHIAAPGRDDLP
jgi:hypothetical protein